MKKLVLLSILPLTPLFSFSQYIPVAEQGRVWYSQGMYDGNIWTEVLAVEGDTLISGVTYPLLVEKDSSLSTVDTLAYLDEDTVAGTLRIDFFGTSPDVFYDFSLDVSDTVLYASSSSTEEAIVDTVYHITDFRGISRKVMEFVPGPNSKCGASWDVYSPWVEGLGAGLLLRPLPICDLSVIENYRLKCVFDGQTRIYGDTVQECYREKIGLAEQVLPKLDLYPNPVSDVLVIDSELPVRFVKIYDLHGKIVREIEEPSGSIDVIELSGGVFILQLENQDGKISARKFQKL